MDVLVLGADVVVTDALEYLCRLAADPGAPATLVLVGTGFWHTFREDDHWPWDSSPSAGRAVQPAQPSVFEHDS
ncbi:hypothetical protein [Streptomyces nojiriensis]|uniref:hypothetical protein n=1 Tax=Streptomyces nojiriensis TaxID=66374 RepID=UPI00366405FB